MRTVYLKKSIEEYFNLNDMKKLGSGIEARVYSDGKYAYKCLNYKSRYIKWLRYLKRTKVYTSVHVPKVYGIYVCPNRYRCVVKMELLRPMKVKESKICNDIYRKVYKLADSTAKRHVGIDRVLRNIGLFVRDYGANLDIHGGNIMMRKDKYVITDPVT